MEEFRIGRASVVLSLSCGTVLSHSPEPQLPHLSHDKVVEFSVIPVLLVCDSQVERGKGLCDFMFLFGEYTCVLKYAQGDKVKDT